MADTPNLNEMKDATESGKLVDAFKLLVTHDKAEEISFIARIGEESSQLRAVIEKKEKTVTEVATSFTRFNDVAETGGQCMLEVQQKDRRKLDLLAQLLVLSRQSLEEKDELLERLEEAEADDEGLFPALYLIPVLYLVAQAEYFFIMTTIHLPRLVTQTPII